MARALSLQLLILRVLILPPLSARELRTELTLPGSNLNEMAYPHVYPSPPQTVARVWGPTSELPERVRSELETGWFFYLAEIATRRIMNDALSSRYQPSSWYFQNKWWTEEEEHHFVQYVERLDGELESWYATLPAPMVFPRDPAKPVGDVMRAILRGHLLDIREVLYFPALKALCESSQLQDLGPRTQQLARLAMENDMSRIAICEEGPWHRHQGTWLMLRNCTKSILHLLAIALRGLNEPALRALLPSGWDQSVIKVMRWIESWKHESPDLELVHTMLQRISSCAGLPLS